MPLRDHFHRPWSEENPWEGFHSAWVNTLVRHLNGSLLPRHFRAFPQVHAGLYVEFQVQVHDSRRGMRLVAVVELVSPGNKDRPEERQAFVAKCAGYLQERIGVVLVDIVTTRRANLHAGLLELFSVAPIDSPLPDLYCVSYRNWNDGPRPRLDLWPFPLAIGSPLPTVPLWLGASAVPLDLEKTYQETCEVLRIE
jgi:hypothetical protein